MATIKININQSGTTNFGRSITKGSIYIYNSSDVLIGYDNSDGKIVPISGMSFSGICTYSPGSITLSGTDIDKASYTVATISETSDKTINVTINRTIPKYNNDQSYEIAVLRGFTGTEEEWIETLKAKIKDVTVDDSEAAIVGTPKVSVDVGGTPYDRILNFVFKELKGEKGDTGDAAVERLTIAEYNELKEQGKIANNRFYFATSTADKLIRVYAGDTLIAQASGTSIFPLTFPFTFAS